MKLKLYLPVKPMKINQKFGQNATDVYNKQGFPGHPGIDFYATHGEPVYASHDGYASFQIDGMGGHGVVVITDKEYEYLDGTSFFKTIYWHLVDGLKELQYQSPIADKTGFVPVKTGDLIGYADSTGVSTGDHLHYGLKPVAKGESWGSWYNTEQNNGYNGAIDPEPYLTDVFAQDISRKYTGLIHLGSRGQDVIWLQSMLKLVTDGIFGPKTLQAVRDFQDKHGLKNDGIVGPLTFAELQKHD